jgi:hypothetical protein
MSRAARAVLVCAFAACVGGCGIGATTTGGVPSGVTATPSGPPPVSAAVAQTKAAITAALAPANLQIVDAVRPFRPPETARLSTAPRAVYQAILADDPDGGYVVVYEFRDSGAAIDAGNELAGYAGSGAGRVQFPTDARHTIRQLGTTLIVYTWAPSTSSDPGAARVADALSTLGIGFAPPR